MGFFMSEVGKCDEPNRRSSNSEFQIGMRTRTAETWKAHNNSQCELEIC